MKKTWHYVYNVLDNNGDKITSIQGKKQTPHIDPELAHEWITDWIDRTTNVTFEVMRIWDKNDAWGYALKK